MYRMFALKAGDYVVYMDMKRRRRQLKYIRDTGLVRAIVGQDYSIQQQFEDEIGSIVHVPLNAWALTQIKPRIIRRFDYGV